MPWDNARPRKRKYDATHNTTRARHMAQLRAAGTGYCAEIVCLEPNRIITPDMDLHLCHDATGARILGLGHSRCNRAEAARRARSWQNTSRLKW